MLGQQGDNHGRVFGALGFVDGYRIGQAHLAQFGKKVSDWAAIKDNNDFLRSRIDPVNSPHIPVKDRLVIVVFNLHDFIVGPETKIAATHGVHLRIQPFLQSPVEIHCTHDPFVHRRKDLDVGHRIEAEQPGNMIGNQTNDKGQGFFRILSFPEIEISFPGCRRKIRDFPPVDSVGIDNDPTGFRLPEYLRERHHGKAFRGDDIAQHVSRPNGRELMDIAHQDKGRMHGNCFEKMVHEHSIDH